MFKFQTLICALAIARGPAARMRIFARKAVIAPDTDD
ncbi:hypothetical protein MTsPCn3_25540 [Erythrobacter sp. MTPC3]